MSACGCGGDEDRAAHTPGSGRRRPEPAEKGACRTGTTTRCRVRRGAGELSAAQIADSPSRVTSTPPALAGPLAIGSLATVASLAWDRSHDKYRRPFELPSAVFMQVSGYETFDASVSGASRSRNRFRDPGLAGRPVDRAADVVIDRHIYCGPPPATLAACPFGGGSPFPRPRKPWVIRSTHVQTTAHRRRRRRSWRCSPHRRWRWRAPRRPRPARPVGGFVVRHGADLKLDGKKFTFAGSNNYYLMYKSQTMVDDVFADAKAAGFTVLRTWGFLDIGNADGTNSIRGKPGRRLLPVLGRRQPRPTTTAPTGCRGWTTCSTPPGRPASSWSSRSPTTGTTSAAWTSTCAGAAARYHDDFYTDPVIRGWYKDWISHVLNRVNTAHRRGVQGRPDDHDVGAGQRAALPVGRAPTRARPTAPRRRWSTWADEMTRHIKSVDRHHLASVGDEGFFCDDPASADWTATAARASTRSRLTALPAVDVMSYHLYPDGWGKDLAWATRLDHAPREGGPQDRQAGDARRVRLVGQGHPQPLYQTWTDAFDAAGGNGFAVLDPLRQSRTTARSTRTTTASPSTARARSAPRWPTPARSCRRAALAATGRRPRRRGHRVRHAGHADPGGERHRLPDQGQAGAASTSTRPRPASRRPSRWPAARLPWPANGTVTFTPRGRLRRPGTGSLHHQGPGRPHLQCGRSAVTVKPDPDGRCRHGRLGDRRRGLGAGELADRRRQRGPDHRLPHPRRAPACT